MDEGDCDICMCSYRSSFTVVYVERNRSDYKDGWQEQITKRLRYVSDNFMGCVCHHLFRDVDAYRC